MVVANYRIASQLTSPETDKRKKKRESQILEKKIKDKFRNKYTVVPGNGAKKLDAL